MSNYFINAHSIPPLVVLHPSHKLVYFAQAGWPDEWRATAEEIVRAEFERAYADIEILDSNEAPLVSNCPPTSGVTLTSCNSARNWMITLRTTFLMLYQSFRHLQRPRCMTNSLAIFQNQPSAPLIPFAGGWRRKPFILVSIEWPVITFVFQINMITSV